MTSNIYPLPFFHTKLIQYKYITYYMKQENMLHHVGDKIDT